jgi:ring-1,2-phenylacetyl-CoA epoxidase subunit PaaC
MNSLINYITHLADCALVLGHRNSEWCGHGPVLEQDIALTNISLDHIGQARAWYQLAAHLLNEKENTQQHSEDTLAYLRDARDFKNFAILELPKGHWGFTILRQFLMSSYNQIVYTYLSQSGKPEVKAIAVKSLKEILYHVSWSTDWVLRLGDGTAESHEKMQNALNELWPHCAEFFEFTAYEEEAFIELGIENYNGIKQQWLTQVSKVLTDSRLITPSEELKVPLKQYMAKNGYHTEHLGYLLAEMQTLQRSYPNSQW